MPVYSESAVRNKGVPESLLLQVPTTPDEWRAALDTVVALRAVDAAGKYGLPRVNVECCGEILRRAKAMGHTPSSGTVEWVTAPGQAGRELSRFGSTDTGQ